MIIRLVLMAAGVLLIGAAGALAPVVDIISKKAALGTVGPVTAEEEDEILSNKTKWGIIIAGYVIFALIAVFSVFSIFTLNYKINTLYKSVQELERMQVPIEEREPVPFGKD